MENQSKETTPLITAEEFARIQNDGEVIRIGHDGRIRVRVVGRASAEAARNGQTEPGISLRKRRAWY